MLEKLTLFGAISPVTLVAKNLWVCSQEKSYFKMLGLSLSSKLHWSPYNISITNTASKKIGALIRCMKIFHLRLHFICINLPYGFAWNTVLISRLMLVAANWIC